MKAETQANALASLVQKKNSFKRYELILPFFQVKQSTLKRLEVGNVLLVGLDNLILFLVSESKIHASAKIVSEKNIYKLKINTLQNDMLTQPYIEKYQTIKCSFGFIQSKKLDVGNRLSTHDINLKKIKIFVEEKNIAEAILVKVNNEIAIEVTKVHYV